MMGRGTTWLAMLALCVTISCLAQMPPAAALTPQPVTLDADHAFTGQALIHITGVKGNLDFPYRIDATPSLLKTVSFTGEASISPGSRLALNAYIVARRGRFPLDFTNLTEHPITATSESGWRPFSLRLLIPPNTDIIEIGMRVSHEGELDLRNLVIEQSTTPLDKLRPDIEAYDLLALKAMRGSALEGTHQDWPELREYLLLATQHAQVTSDTYEALRVLLATIDPRHHSRLLTPNMIQALNADAKQQTAIISAGHEQEQIATILMPGFDGVSDQATTKFVTSAAGLLAGAAGHARCGWVIDLRQDSGGNMWPMLGILAPFLGNGIFGSFNYPDHVVPLMVKHGDAYEGFDRRQRSVGASPELARSRVAIIIGPNTFSSGEAVAIAFHGRPDTRSFGNATGGLSSSNDYQVLSDGAVMLVTAAIDADRNGKLFGEGIQPDEQVMDESGAEEDRPMLAAKHWLTAQCGTAARTSHRDAK